MELDLVIKVKYGDTLRRFNAYGVGNTFKLNVDELRAKILDLFKLNPDADFTLTYVDEDGDAVTLVDDDDLCDAVVTQRLNPLRINVLLSTNKIGTPGTRSLAESSTPTRSPSVGIQLPPRVSAGVDEALGSMPQPFRDTLLNLSSDMTTKAALSAPALTDLVEYFSKLGKSYLGPLSQVQDGGVLTTASNSSHPMDLNITVRPEGSSDLIASPKGLPTTRSVDQTSYKNLNGKDSSTMTTVVGAAAPTTPFGLFNLDNPFIPFSSDFSTVVDSVPCVRASKESAEVGDGHHDGKAEAVVSSFVPLVDHFRGLNPHSSSDSSESSLPAIYGSADVLEGDKHKKSTDGVGPSASHVGSSESKCPSGSQMAADASVVVHPRGLYPVVPPFKVNTVHHNMLRTFHRGVRCDGCGMHPIIGPRFKSKVKEDYDLCNICFSEMGNESDYTRIDRAAYRSLRMKEFYNHHHPRFQNTHSRVRVGGMKVGKQKLESSFVQDVTVLDGTLMPPLTPFTKIWRMRNSGTVVWPPGTQLVWIGGDQFGERGSIELKIPQNGCPVDEELDIAVDFTAPSRPGRYISYWTMALPSGQKFGQHVWVLVQVHESQQDSVPDGAPPGLNLNLPPGISVKKGNGVVIDVNVEPMDGGHIVPDGSNVAAEVVKPTVEECPRMTQELNLQVDDAAVLLACSGVTLPLAETAATSGSHPLVDVTEPSTATTEEEVTLPLVDGSGTTEEVLLPSQSEVSAVEQTLLKELEEMGFKQIDLNKEILKLNDYDLEQSLDDLCGIAEWDPILEELQEMGFSNREVNRKLLVKNGGSIKRVVLDLIAGEKA
ncbi:protein NBR1 homolog [Magnolia sinica]|uniref:protein NBR1 homolog n=1 Tax=Magnolia sinica TaxID=86752 RepID=UPI0026585121|nr:protein NBR1 homolog [Magnolia sinica]